MYSAYKWVGRPPQWNKHNSSQFPDVPYYIYFKDWNQHTCKTLTIKISQYAVHSGDQKQPEGLFPEFMFGKELGECGPACKQLAW